MTAALWHYTCADHGQPGIVRDGLLIPNAHPLLPEPLVWATDLDEPLREALGLTSAILSCDRTAVRVQVLDPALFEPWSRYAHDRRIAWQVRHALESARGARPAHWHVSRLPVRAVPA